MGEDNGTEGTRELPSPPSRLYERLAQISGYTWDTTLQPFHSSYDNWHVFGLQHDQYEASTTSSLRGLASTNSTKSSPRLGPRSPLRRNDTSSDLASENISVRLAGEKAYVPVVARISTHALRIEREYHLCKSFISESDPDCSHVPRLIDLVKLPSRPGDGESLTASIFESPGRDYLKDLLDLGPAWLGSTSSIRSQTSDASTEHPDGATKQISLSTFLEFAIGACECLELLHHGLKAVHGELRADAFHFNRDTGSVKLINFGSGPRSFENGLTSTGWLTLSREPGVKHKLQYIAPEQTGRMPAEPDSRTDIYSLGVLFWTLLTGRPAFEGEAPIDVIQAVLARRLPLVSSKRMDIPDVISNVIRKMTQKQIDERYNSTSGLKHDVVEIQRMLGDGDTKALVDFVIGSKDVSSFFMLPTQIFGRTEEHGKIIKVIEKVTKQQLQTSQETPSYSFASASASTLSDRYDPLENGTRSSDTSSQTGNQSGTSQALGPLNFTKMTTIENGTSSGTRPKLEVNDSKESLETISSEGGRSGLRPDQLSASHVGTGQMPRRRGSHKSRRRRRCEVVSILGAGGLGKSRLLQGVQSEVRKTGYFAAAKFDPARKAPFVPLIHTMGSLFRQIFSESDLNSDYHVFVRHQLRGFWQSIHVMLDLPESLIYAETQHAKRNPAAFSHQGLNKSVQTEIADVSSTHSAQSGSLGTGSYMTSDLLRGGANPRSLKFITVFVEVLRILSANRLICLCLDDLQFADDESLQLVSSIISKKLGILIMTTCRDDGDLSPSVQDVLRNRDANSTVIKLTPLKEEEVVRYVAATLQRTPKYVLPLAVVCLEKSNGNPFYLRQMLELCHRKQCIFYSWKESVWDYKLDRVFTEFASKDYGQQLDSNFITRRLQDLPPAACAILGWASLLGTSFSFTMVQRLLTGEFDYKDDDDQFDITVELLSPQPVENVVEGLQATLQAYILMPGSSEDEFSFSHDRYVQASAALNECYDVEKMHYIIVQTIMKYDGLDSRSVYAKARHVCHAYHLINRRVMHRRPYRDLLFEAAAMAIESGGRPTALKYYEICLALMQPDPWKKDAEDVDYEETLDVYTKAAELFCHQGRYSEAQNTLDAIFANARTPAQKAPAWIFQSKLFAQSGNMEGALTALKTSLMELGLDFASKPTWGQCDKDFDRLRRRLQNATSVDLLEQRVSTDPAILSMGGVIIEAVSAAFWSDTLLFYQMSLKMVEMHLNNLGTFPQIGLGFGYLAMVCISRSADIAFAFQMHEASEQLLSASEDSYTKGRGLQVSALFVAHLLSPIRSHANTLEEAIDHSIVSGDKHVYLLCVGGIAMSKVACGEDMAELESFCAVAPEDFGEWTGDLQGGACLIACRQVARSLQGKTWIESAESVMSDDSHTTASYMSFMKSRDSNAERPRTIYLSSMLIPLFLYGYHDKILDVSSEIIPIMGCLWSLRITRSVLFYTSLSIIAKIRQSPSCKDREELLAKVEDYKAQIVQWQRHCNANYLMWSLLIEAEVCDVQQQFHPAIQAYEAAIDHTQLYDFNLELALAFELQGEFFVRRGAKRAARSTIMDSMATYSRMGACGKVIQMAAKHEWVLTSSANIRTQDVGIQTAVSAGDIGNTQARIEENERQETRNLGKETADDRTKAWVSPTPKLEPGQSKGTRPEMSGLGLDILDLTSILEFNQAISSELQIDRLLAKMTEIILESAGAQADLAGVVVEGENGWCIAASGTADGISAESLPITEIQDETQKQVLLYTMRFKEVVFVHNLGDDDRFCNIPSSKSVLSLPILQGKDLLGVLYLEGQQNSFTHRNLGVLQLFCNQVGISIANALLFRRLAKVSASNTSMIESQKRALANARKAEIKAKIAEADAMESVRLKEEAAKAKSMFLANVSHELRTPLNGVIGMSELLKASELNQEQDGYADSIRVCADTLLTVINDILDFSKLEAGKMQLFSVPLNLKETIAEVVRALSYTNIERGLKTLEELDLDPKLLVMGDPVRLHQIFMNLLSNSYKFTAEGSVTVRARADYEDKRSIRVTCSVTDTGIGITQEQVSRLFKPFAQADSSTQRSYGGSGLGLSICKALINVLKGTISLESQLGKGTTVSFTLTFQKAAASATNTNAEISAREPDPMATWSSDVENLASRSSTASLFDLSQIPRDQLRICIAEDNPINQKIAVSFVNKLGFKSEAYSDGMQAVEALRRGSKEMKPFHLVLMDVQMPVLDGYDATRLIRKDDDPRVRGVVIVAMTASAIRGDREKCIQAGMNNYLAKPVRAAVLKTMLEEYLSVPPKRIEGLEEKAADLAKEVINGDPDAEKRPVAHRSRLSFSQRMSSRNDIPTQNSETSTPRPGLPHSGSYQSDSAITPTELTKTAEEDPVPPLSLNG